MLDKGVNTVSIDGITDYGITDIVAEWAEQVAREDAATLKANVTKAAKTCRKVVKEKAPKKTGKYAKGWKMRVKAESEPIGDYVSYVYEGDKPGLTHLLEKGHAEFLWGVPTGRRVQSFPHIAPAYEEGAKELMP